MMNNDIQQRISTLRQANPENELYAPQVRGNNAKHRHAIRIAIEKRRELLELEESGKEVWQ
jgi:hypothetical protein